MADFDSSSIDPALEKEIADALGGQSLEELMFADTQDGKRDPKRRTGTIISIHKGDVLVEFSAKEQGVCDVSQFKEPPERGEEREFILVSRIPGEGIWRLALPGGAAKADWDTLQTDMVVEAMVTGTNTGGIELEIANHKAFMPISQIDIGRVEDSSQYVGQKLRAQVVELDKNKRRIILSRRALLEAEAAENREQLFETLEEGTELEGTVRRIEKFGAFVEIAPGVDGLLHISDMAWTRVKDPNQIVTLGQLVTVCVLRVDKEQGRISLGLKQVSGDPWREVEHRYAPGTKISGKVTRTTAFGAFVELEPGVEGLVHISQLSSGRVSRVEDIAKEGDTITVQVTEIDLGKRRIGLSIRAIDDASTDAAEAAARAEAQEFIKSSEQAHAMESLMGKFGDGDGLKGGIG